MFFPTPNAARRQPALAPTAGWTDLDRVFRTFLDGIESLTTPAGAFPRLNVWTSDAALFVEAAVPGYTRDQIEVSVQGDKLWIEGRVESADETREETYHRRERSLRSFRRSLPLPIPVDADHVEATMSDAVLRIELPKATEARPRQIQVKANRG